MTSGRGRLKFFEPLPRGVRSVSAVTDSVIHFLLLLCLPVAYLLGRAAGFTSGWRSADRLLDARERQISELRRRLEEAPEQREE